MTSKGYGTQYSYRSNRAHRRGWLTATCDRGGACQGLRGPFLLPERQTESWSKPMTQQMTGAEMVIQAMLDQGVEYIFGYPGGAVLPIYDAMFQQQKLKHILVRHEQGAGHAAEGYARSTGKVGCVLVTSGPGATNAVTGLTD